MKKIMVIDDETEFLSIMRSFLESVGFEVLTIPTPEHVYAIISEFNPDLIILDVHLNEVDGQGISREIKDFNDDLNIPVLLCTADKKIQDDLADSKADEIIIKPFTFDELTSKINKLLDSYAIIRNLNSSDNSFLKVAKG